MKNLLPWIKSNMGIVVLSAVILLILPAAFVGSSMWNKSIRRGREKAVTTAMSQLDNAKVTYQLPPAVPGHKAIEFPLPAPNPAATEFFRKHRTAIEEQVKLIAVEAETINKQGHEPLMDGVFPAPASSSKTLEFAVLLVGESGKPSAYQKLFNDINAGSTAPPADVAQVLNEANTQEIEKKKASANTDKLTEEETKAHLEHLVKLRVGQYKEHAKTIAVYATTDCLPKEVLRTIPPEPPPVTACWGWQEDYWVIRDLLNAVKEANTIDGKLGGVDRSVVKRIEQITLLPRETAADTVTGRKNSAANTVYEMRTAAMTVIVSSARLPSFINAISRTNFMSVVDIDFAEVDTGKDLERGYYYGDEHVVQATVAIESIWLKSWTGVMMPEEEKKRREATGEETAAAAPAPMPSPRGSRAMPDDNPAPASKPKPKSGRSTKKPGSKKGGE